MRFLGALSFLSATTVGVHPQLTKFDLLKRLGSLSLLLDLVVVVGA
jgi:hypothetical protein